VAYSDMDGTSRCGAGSAKHVTEHTTASEQTSPPISERRTNNEKRTTNNDPLARICYIPLL
jgi:hypothetical protein